MTRRTVVITLLCMAFVLTGCRAINMPSQIPNNKNEVTQYTEDSFENQPTEFDYANALENSTIAEERTEETNEQTAVTEETTEETNEQTAVTEETTEETTGTTESIEIETRPTETQQTMPSNSTNEEGGGSGGFQPG